MEGTEARLLVSESLFDSGLVLPKIGERQLVEFPAPARNPTSEDIREAFPPAIYERMLRMIKRHENDSGTAAGTVFAGGDHLDTASPPNRTLGYGRNLSVVGILPEERHLVRVGADGKMSITEAGAERLLMNDVARIFKTLMKVDWFRRLGPVRRAAMVDFAMAGVGTVLGDDELTRVNLPKLGRSGFPAMIEALRRTGPTGLWIPDFVQAGKEIVTNSAGTGPSKYKRQVGARADQLQQLIETGDQRGLR